MTLETQRKLDQAKAVMQSAQSIQHSIESLRTDGRNDQLTPIRMPGWQLFEPDAKQLSEVRRFTQADSVPGEEQAAFVFQEDFDTNVICTRGSVNIYENAGTENEKLVITLEADPGLSFHFAPRGTKQSMRARIHPTQVLCVAWREAQSGGQQRDSGVV